MQQKVYLQLCAFDEAKDMWMKRFSISPLQSECIPLQQAFGRTLASSARAVFSSPSYHSAAMDGIAVRAEDTFGASAYSPKELLLGKDAFWINTGNPLPSGTNAVIMVEQLYNSPENENIVIIEKAAFPWQYVRKLGEDIIATEQLFSQGTILGAYELGALAAAGVLQLDVYKKAKVAILPTGSELVSLELLDPNALQRGEQIGEFNSLIFSSLVHAVGGESFVFPITQDDPKALRQRLLQAVDSDADLVLINAGSSAGSHDFTVDALTELGEVFVHGIAVMPGKPTILACVQGKPVLGLPGYPVSATLIFEEFGQRLLSMWQNHQNDLLDKRLSLEVHPFQAIPSKIGVEERIRLSLGKVGDRYIAIPLSRGAGTVTSLSRADAICAVPAQSEGVSTNATCKVQLIRDLADIDGAILAIGSHDNALDILNDLLRKRTRHYSLTSAHVGSVTGIKAVSQGLAHLATCHLLDPQTGEYNKSAIRSLMKNTPAKLFRLAEREQGLMVLPHNPMSICGIEDLLRKDVSFLNRQKGSGTRILLDRLLTDKGISSQAVQGYRDEEYTHMSVAAAVLSGRVTTGLGTKSAALALGLDFIPLAHEEYDLLIPLQYIGETRIISLLSCLQSKEFVHALEQMGGYGTSKTGQEIWVYQGE